MHRALHLLAAFAALFLLASALFVEELPAVPREARAVAQSGEALFFDMELTGPEGELLSRPRVLGESGRRLVVEYRDPVSEDPESQRMCLVLDPIGASDGLDLAVELSVDGLVENGRGRLRMPIGERRRLELSTEDGRSVQLALLAYRVDSPEFAAYLERMRSHVARTHAPEA